MAKKRKKVKIETQVMHVDLGHLLSESDKYTKDLIGFLEEKIPQLKTTRETNLLKITVPKTLSTRQLRSYLKKFLYTAALSEKFRPIALQTEEKGFKIFKQPIFE